MRVQPVDAEQSEPGGERVGEAGERLRVRVSRREDLEVDQSFGGAVGGEAIEQPPGIHRA
jgi:hypothetical protein